MLFRTIKKHTSSINVRRVLCFVLVAISGCVEEYLPTVVAADHNYLIVDGFLVGNDSTFIKLSRSQLISDEGAIQKETEAVVEVESETGIRYSLREKSKGLYAMPALNLDTAMNYRLRIRTSDASEYVSEFVGLLESPALDSIVFAENEDDKIDFYLYAHDPNNSSHYFYWTYDETWQYSGGYTIYKWENGQIVPRANAAELLYCWKTNYNNNFYLHATAALEDDVVYQYPFFTIKQTSRKLYYGYSVLVRQYALTRKAYDYYNLTKKNSETLGSLFDPQPSQAAGNIRCTNNPQQIVIGHFSASTVQQKRLFFTRQDIQGPTTGPYESSDSSFCQPKIVELHNMTDRTLEGQLIIDRHYDLITQDLVGYLVGPENCIDCRFGGGVLSKPDYWK